VARSAAGPAPSFAAAKSYPTGKGPGGITTGDLNGDGKPDLVTANSGETVSVLLNRGDGTFEPKRNYATPSRGSLAIADLNGDGKLDLVTANGRVDTVSVFLNRGDGTFGPKRDYATGFGPGSLAIADLNGDGAPDLVTANYVSGTVSVLVNALGRCAVPLLTDSFVRLPAAKRILQRSGCRLGAIRYAYSSVPRGGVISEAPDWGAVLRKGANVNLVVSKGRKH
jgi:hypothetical protein